MKFMVTWQLHADTKVEVMAAWASVPAAKRAALGKGVKFIGRWHDTAGGSGVLIADTNDLAALHRYLGKWTPMMEVSVVAVLDDRESAAVCKKIVADRKG